MTVTSTDAATPGDSGDEVAEVKLVTLTIDARYDQIPFDSSAAILTSGLLGEKYIGIQPGADTESLKQGDEILFTQSAVVLENLISKYLFDSASGGEE